MPAVPHETVLCRYRYDPLDRLNDCAPAVEARTQRFYCKSRLATEIQGEVQCSVFQHDDQLLAQIRREDLKADTTLLATDHQRSVLNALDATRLHPFAYTPYGHRPPENGLLSLLGFNGERPDPVTGHYLLGNGYRALNPVLMRFNSPDSWSPFGEGGLNAYAYCTGNPINGRDPTGHTFLSASLFDKFFGFTYQRMKDSWLRNEQFHRAVSKTQNFLGGSEGLKRLSEGTKAPPDALIAQTMLKQEKIARLEDFSFKGSVTKYLAQARPYLEKLLERRNIQHDLLNTKKYSQHLSPVETRNLTLDLSDTTDEMRRFTQHLLTLRQDAPSASKLFDLEDFTKAATTIREGNNLMTENPYFWAEHLRGYP